MAVGFLLPPILVPNSDDLTEIGRNLGTMYYIDAGLTTTILIIIIFGKTLFIIKKICINP